MNIFSFCGAFLKKTVLFSLNLIWGGGDKDYLKSIRAIPLT